MTVVLITGAGATAKLGLNNESIAQMKDWARHLCERMPFQHRDLLGLHPDMNGPDFEARLGAFLEFARSLPAVARYPAAGVESIEVDTDKAKMWFTRADTTAQEIQRHIYESLHELFPGSRISDASAEQGYGALLNALGPTDLVYATTNYDIAGELALEQLGRRPYDGVDVKFGSRAEPSPVHLDSLLDDASHRVPVLHLHGRVGWYIDGRGQLVSTNADAQFNASIGTPALLLPDPNKAYDDPVSSTIWRHFTTVLAPARLVLVIGHSMNDPHLVRALSVVPDDHLGVACYIERDDPNLRGPACMALRDHLGRTPHMLPMDFGPDPRVDHSRWARFINAEEPLPPEHGGWGSMERLATMRAV